MGVLLLLVGLGVLGFGLFNHLKGKRILAAPFKTTGDLAKNPTSSDPKGAMSTQGKVVPPAQPLLSPCSKQPCLYYEVKVERLYEKTETTEDGTKTTTGTDTLDTVKGGTVFALDDGSGAISVDFEKGADCDNLKEGYQKELNGRSWASNVQFGEFSYDVPVIGSKDGQTTIGFKATEKYVPVEGALFVLGKLEGGKLIKPSWRSMLASSKGREGLLGSIQKKKKFSFIGGGAAAALSIPLMIWGPQGDPNAEGASCQSSLTDLRAKCSARVSSKSGDEYTWTVTEPSQFELEVFAPKKKVPFMPEIVVKDSTGEVIADDQQGIGLNAKATVEVQPGTYTVVVKPGDNYMVKGGFGYELEIRSEALAAKRAAAKATAVADKDGKDPADQADTRPAAAGAMASKTLTKLGVKLNVPADATVEDGAGENSYSIYNEAGFNVAVSLAEKGVDHPTMESMQTFLKLDPNKIKKYTKAEKSKGGGWVLEWEAESMLDPTRTLYGVNVRRIVDGKWVDCERNVDEKAIAAVISQACQSIESVKAPALGKNVAAAPAAKNVPARASKPGVKAAPSAPAAAPMKAAPAAKKPGKNLND